MNEINQYLFGSQFTQLNYTKCFFGKKLNSNLLMRFKNFEWKETNNFWAKYEKDTEIFLFNLLVSICDIFASKQNEITQNKDVFHAKILFETLEWNSKF
jgi:hypothetical protein